MLEIRCHFPLGKNSTSVAIVENTSTYQEVKITIVRNECADDSFTVDGYELIRAIRKCIEE